MDELWIGAALVGIVIGVLAATFVVNYMASGLKSVHMQNSADSYCDSSNPEFEEQSDVFVGSRTEIIHSPRPKSHR